MQRANIEPMMPNAVYEPIRAVPLMDTSKAAVLARLSFQSMRGADRDGGLIPQHEVIAGDYLVTCVAAAAEDLPSSGERG